MVVTPIRSRLRRPKPQFSFFQQLGLQLALTGLLCLLITLTLLYSISQIGAASQAERDGAMVLTTAKQLLQLTTDLETGQRGYLLSGGNTVYLEPFNLARAQLGDTLEQLQQQTAGDSEQTSQVLLITLALESRVQIAENIVSLYQAGREQEALRLFQTNRGKAYHDQIRDATERLKDRETAKQESRSEAVQVSLNFTYATAAGLGILAVISQLYSFQIASREVELRVKAEREARELALKNELMATQLKYTVTEDLIPQIASGEERDRLLKELEQTISRIERDGR